MSTEAPDTTEQAAAVPEDVIDPRLMVREHELRGYWVIFRRRVRGGELGALPVVIGLVVIWTIFYIQEPRFLSAQNLTNLVLQATAVGLHLGRHRAGAAARRDRSVGRVGERVMCMRAGRAQYQTRLACHPRDPSGDLGRSAHRADPRIDLHALRGAILRRHAGRVDRLAGRATGRAWGNRHDQLPVRRPGCRTHQHILPAVGRLSARCCWRLAHTSGLR